MEEGANLQFRSVLEEYVKDRTILYTDCSKTERGMGSSFEIEGVSDTRTLPKAVSVYISERYAV